MTERRDGPWWVAAQTGLFVGCLAAPLVRRRRLPASVRIGGLATMAGSVAWMAWAYRSLGASHSAWVGPAAGAELRTSGAYGVVRHPVYAGWIGLAGGWALATGSEPALAGAALIGLFYAARAATEERLLAARTAGYSAYRGRVPQRFIPGVY